ncbi:MAG: GumC family protein [Alphaproteobacteria bacterium]
MSRSGMEEEIGNEAEGVAPPGAGGLVPAEAQAAAVVPPAANAGEPAPHMELHWLRADSRTLSASGFRRLLRRHRWLILGTAAAITALTAAYVFSVTPLYRAEAKVLVEGDKGQSLNLQGLVPGAQPDLTAIETQAAIIASSELASKAVDRLHLVDDPRYNPELRPSGGGLLARAGRVFGWLGGLFGGGEPKADAASAELLHEAIINRYLAGLRVVPDEKSRVISVAYDSPSPDFSARAANTAAALYVEQAAPKPDSTAKSAGPAGASATELGDRVAAAERRLAEFHSSSAGAGNALIYQQQLARLDGDLSQLRLDIADAKAKSDQAQQLAASDKAMSVETPIDDAVVQDLRQQYNKLQADLAELRTEYTDSHPKVQEVLAQQAELRGKIRAELGKVAQTLRSQYDQLKAREQKLMQDESRLQAKINEQSGAEAKKAALESDVKTSRELYQAMLARINQQPSADGEKARQPATRIISEAAVPTSPVYPQKAATVGAAFGLSLVIGILLALVIEYVESGFRTRSELESRTGLAVLGLVPLAPKSANPKPPHMRALDEPNSTYGEAIRSLRSALLQPRGGYRPRVIMVTSSIPGEGKTSTAVSIATTAARARLKTILVECDVLRPSLYNALHCSIGPGLGDYLAGRARIEEVVRVDPVSGAHYITAGDPMPSASELLDSEGLRLLVTGMREIYDLVVIDSPPVLAVSDTVVVQRLVDETVFLVRWKKTPRDIVFAALRQIAESGGTIAGLALTQVDVRKHSIYEFGKHADKYYSAYRSYHSDAA